LESSSKIHLEKIVLTEYGGNTCAKGGKDEKDSEIPPIHCGINFRASVLCECSGRGFRPNKRWFVFLGTDEYGFSRDCAHWDGQHNQKRE
jgi:hypothetical protein